MTLNHPSNVTTTTLLEVEDLSVFLSTEHGRLTALTRITLSLAEKETLALVGESGCGKSMTCLAMLGLLPAGAETSGRIAFVGTDLLSLHERDLEQIRGREIAMIFQDPMSSLNPVIPIGRQVSEILTRHFGMVEESALAETRRLLDRVQIPAAARRLREYPHQLSGGMCQRVMIAIAIACKPRLLIADEPTTALDVTIQAQILGLLHELQQELGMAMILVTHDLGVVAQIAQSAAVMYAGSIVEQASVGDLFSNPGHPYTQALLSALPYLAKESERLVSIPGQVPALTNRPAGCSFHSRCRQALDRCSSAIPTIEDRSKGRRIACFNDLISGAPL